MCFAEGSFLSVVCYLFDIGMAFFQQFNEDLQTAIWGSIKQWCVAFEILWVNICSMEQQDTKDSLVEIISYDIFG